MLKVLTAGGHRNVRPIAALRIAASALLFIGTGAMAAPPEAPSSISTAQKPAPAEFLGYIDQVLQLDIREAQIIMGRSQDGSVKQIAADLDRDARNLQPRLFKLFETLKVERPEDLDYSFRVRVFGLTHMNTPSLDRAFISDQIQSHVDVLNANRQQDWNQASPELRDFAATMVDSANRYLARLRAVEDSVNAAALTAPHPPQS